MQESHHPENTGVAFAWEIHSEFGSLAENARFLNKPLIWKCYFPVPAALVPIWRPKIGIWEPCRNWSLGLFILSYISRTNSFPGGSQVY